MDARPALHLAVGFFTNPAAVLSYRYEYPHSPSLNSVGTHV
jgi:hypothetical protein